MLEDMVNLSSPQHLEPSSGLLDLPESLPTSTSCKKAVKKSEKPLCQESDNVNDAVAIAHLSWFLHNSLANKYNSRDDS